MAGDVDHGDFAPTSSRRAEPAAAPDERNSALSATTPLDLERAHLETPHKTERPSREEAEAAVRTLLRWTGDDPARDGLLDTPGRVVRAWEDWFRSEEHTSELQSLMRISYAVFCLKKKTRPHRRSC